LTTKIPLSIPKKYRDRVEHWDDERALGNSLIVSLKPGWYWLAEGEGVHVRGFDTIAEAKSDLRDTAPCCCPECA
jgi:hypothetical protein